MLKVLHNAQGKGLEVLSKQMSVTYTECCKLPTEFVPWEWDDRFLFLFSEEH